MAVSRFATNNLVKEHDMYVKFLQMREDLIKEKGLTNVNKFVPDGYGLLNRFNNDMSKTAICRGLSKWRCIHLSYGIWRELVGDYTSTNVTIPCKRFISVHESILERFKTLTEQAIREEKCDYNTRLPHRQATYDACRYLAMYWTYLDIIKDDKIQRYYPDAVTRRRAAKVFGYDVDENPFQMNGIYWDWEADKEEEQPMEEKTEVNDDILNTPIRDLNFTIRTFNCLYRSKILTLGDICMRSQRQLLKVRNLGRNSLNEIKAKLAEYDYYYMDLDSNAQKAHPKEESVVDIVEHVAKTLGIQSPSEVIGGTNEEKPEMKPIVSVDEYDELYTKYNDIQIGLSELSKRYETLLKEKTDLEQYNNSLNDDINNLKLINKRLKDRLNGMAVNINKMDTIDLVKLVISNMNKDEMDWLFLNINDMTIDIHKKAEIENGRMSYTIRTKEV